jgi:hypothetical protein
VQIFTASQTSLATPWKPVETYTTLWSADGTTTQGAFNVSYAQSAGGYYVCDSIGIGNVAYTDSRAQIFTLSSNAKSTQKYAFETTVYINSSSYTLNVALWDMTSNALVSSSQVTTTATTATVVRSGQFTLTPGHIYGVTIWCPTSSATGYLSDASLITFP